MVAANAFGRQVVVPLTNKSGGGVIAGDVVYLSDGTNADSFTTGTTSAYTGGIGIAQGTIANNAVGLVLISGYAALVNVNASVTIKHYGYGYTVAKQATDAGTSRIAGTFCQFLTGGTTPDAVIWQPDLGGGSGLVNPMTTTGDIIYASSGSTPARLAAAAAGSVLTAAGAGVAPAWAAQLTAASYKRTSGDYTTSSATFVDVDNTNLALTITTGAHRVLIGFTGTVIPSAAGQIVALDVTVDGTRQGGDRGMVVVQQNVNDNGSFMFLTSALSAGSHTFKLQWLSSSGTATIWGGSTGNSDAQFFVIEQAM